MLAGLLRKFDYPNRGAISFLTSGFTKGFSIGFNGFRDRLVISPNHPSADLQQEVLSKQLAEEVKNGWISEFPLVPNPRFIGSPLGMTEKSSGGWRRIHDLSWNGVLSINAGIWVPPFEYGSFDQLIDAVLGFGKGCVIFKLDVDSAFRLLPVAVRDRQLLGFSFRGKFYTENRLPFGLSSSPWLFDRFMDALTFVLSKAVSPKISFKLIRYCDDLAIVTGSLDDALIVRDTFVKLAASLGAPFSAKKLKAEGNPDTKCIFLGCGINTETMTSFIPANRKTEAINLCEKAAELSSFRLDFLQSLVGKLSFAARILPLFRPFLRPLFDMMSSFPSTAKSSTCPVTPEAAAALQTCQKMLAVLPPCSLLRSDKFTDSDGKVLSSIPCMYSDACSSGAGAWCEGVGQYFSATFSPSTLVKADRSSSTSIPFLELLAAVTALKAWLPHLDGNKAVIFIDNISVVAMVNNLTSSDSGCALLLEELALLLAETDKSIRAIHLSSEANLLADLLSRDQVAPSNLCVPLRCSRSLSSPCVSWPLTPPFLLEFSFLLSFRFLLVQAASFLEKAPRSKHRWTKLHTQL
jgi:hypothetical protein